MIQVTVIIMTRMIQVKLLVDSHSLQALAVNVHDSLDRATVSESEALTRTLTPPGPLCGNLNAMMTPSRGRAGASGPH